jgi:hypothetical protein
MSACPVIGPITDRLHPYLYTVGATDEGFCIIALDRTQCGQLLKTVVEGELAVMLEAVICSLSTASLRADRRHPYGVQLRSNTFCSIRNSDVAFRVHEPAICVWSEANSVHILPLNFFKDPF